MLVGLVHRMLAVEESDRPKASEVTSQHQLIALNQVAAAVDELFSCVGTKTNSLDAFIERKRFAAWRYAIRIPNLETSPDCRTKPNDGKRLDLGPLVECLPKICKHLE